MNDLYYDHNGKGPGVARIIEANDREIEFECKSSPARKRWKYVKMSRVAFERSGWKKRKPLNISRA